MAKYEIAAVVAEFNYDITQMMLELAQAEAKKSYGRSTCCSNNITGLFRWSKEMNDKQIVLTDDKGKEVKFNILFTFENDGNKYVLCYEEGTRFVRLVSGVEHA